MAGRPGSSSATAVRSPSAYAARCPRTVTRGGRATARLAWASAVSEMSIRWIVRGAVLLGQPRGQNGELLAVAAAERSTSVAGIAQAGENVIAFTRQQSPLARA